MNRLVEYFLPSKWTRSDSVERRRAQIAIKTALVLTVSGTFMAGFSYLRLGSLVVVGAILLVTAVVGLAPLVLRRTGSMTVAGNVILVPNYFLITGVAMITGGNLGTTTSWLLILPVLAMLFHGVKAARIWMAVVVVTWLGFFGASVAGYPFESLYPAEMLEARRLVEILLLGILIFVVFRLKGDLQEWLVGAVEQKEAETRAILDTAPDGILTMTTSGEVHTMNLVASQLFGRERRGLVGRSILEVIPELPLAQIEASPAAFTAFGTTQEHQGIRGDEKFPLEVSFGSLGATNPNELTDLGDLGDQREQKLVLVVRDISERKEHQQALQQARDEAVQANLAKSSFLANMSHELRTPLNAVIGYSEMIQEEIEMEQSETPSAPMTEFLPDLGRIRNAGKHLLAIINDILDLSKIEAGKMSVHPEVFDLTDLLEDVVATVQPLAQDNNNALELSLEDDLRFMTSDFTKIRQILFNLLSNACKFTSDGTVFLRARRESDWIVFDVEDTGIGMSEEQIQKIFEAFVQADSSTTRQFGGTGLGLTITRQFCQLLGGKLEVESEKGEGTTFTVRVAADLIAALKGESLAAAVVGSSNPALESTTGSNSEMGGQTVLVVDDDPVVRDLLRRTLEMEGFVVVTAASGSEGLALAEQLEPCAITLDVMMPTMDGWSLLVHLKEHPRLSTIPVIMVTMVSEAARGYALGADHYLVKPVDRQSLVKLLRPYQGDAEEPPGRALVVEDDEATRELFRRTLEGVGWQVQTACDGEEGLQALSQAGPDVVVLDLMMPRVDGFEFLRRFRSDPKFANTPVVVVTAKELTPKERQTLEDGVNEILTKGSVGQKQLLEEVRRMVARSTDRERHAKKLDSVVP